MLFKDWLNEWLESYVKPTVKLKTYDRYLNVINVHLARIGFYELQDLTPIVLQRFVAQLSANGNIKTDKGLSASTVNGIITVIQSSLKTAYNIGLIQDYLADKIIRPKSCERQIICFSEFEQKKIEQIIISENNTRLYGVLLCLYTGLRIGELLALLWSDIDFDNGIITVSKTCHDGKDTCGRFARIIEEPKTQSSKRCIPMPKQLIPFFKKMKANSRSCYVISHGVKPIGVRSYQKSFELLLKKTNISRKGFHALRHTFATRALESGMDVKTLSEVLGHKNAAVTLNRYVHSLIEHKRNMMNNLGKRLSGIL